MYSYWGKSDNGQVHLLPYHSIDVATIAFIIAKENGLAFTNELFFATCLHDLGKFYSGFQHLIPDNVRKLKKSDYEKKEYGRAFSIHHSSWGVNIWNTFKRVANQNNLNVGWLNTDDSTLMASFGHHGKPIIPVSEDVARDKFIKEDILAAKSFVENIFDITEGGIQYRCKGKEMSSWEFAGLVNMADWLASNPAWINFTDKKHRLKDYCTMSLSECEKIPHDIYRVKAKIKPFEFSETFGFKPSPLQTLVLNMNIDKQNLFILEDTTGAGKTEAAITLACRVLNHNGGKGGFYFALPTMATSNSLYKRILAIKKHISEGDIILAHSKAFQENQKLLDSIKGSAMKYEARAWLLDNRKKCLLAPFGVGTIDQILSAILPLKHQSLRLFGISSKVLILDEVHSYDTYMIKEIETLIKFHSSFGGSVIITSATLTKKIKQSLNNAFYDGVSLQREPLVCHDDYPLTTAINSTGNTQKACRTPGRLQRVVKVPIYSNLKKIDNETLKCVRRGGNVCVIKNTVNEAIKEYSRLKKLHDNVILFHSRFAFKDRADIESKVLNYFGKGSDQKGVILVATQVVEQSLDIDFDLMVSDLCPADILIQRVGRCHRHDKRRVDGFRTPKIIIYSGDNKGWLTGIEGTKYVYINHGALFHTLNWITKHDNKISCPEEIRDFIEYAYGDHEIPNHVMEGTLEAQNKSIIDKGKAQQVVLDFSGGYDVNAASVINWESDDFPMTRLIENNTKQAYMSVDGRLYGGSTSKSEIVIPQKIPLNDDNIIDFTNVNGVFNYNDEVAYTSEIGVVWGSPCQTLLKNNT